MFSKDYLKGEHDVIVENNTYENVNMNKIVGTHNILFICLDSLRYDVAVEEQNSGNTPVLNQFGKWQKCQAVGNFTYPAHQGMFAGFFPCYYDAKKHKERISLFFPENVGMGKTAPKYAYSFSQKTFVEALAFEGYETCCIGGVSFFDKRSGLGKVLPGYFSQSFWNPAFSPLVADSTKNQVRFAIKWLDKLPSDKRIFLYINISAIHYPNYYYLKMNSTDKTTHKIPPYKGYEHDSKESHAAALRYADRELEPLFNFFRQKGPAFVICCSDHGTCYGEDGCFSHGINHPMVNIIPYKHFILTSPKNPTA